MYHNVTELVQAVLDLKNKLCKLPPEAYVEVVKVSGGGGCWSQPWKEGGGVSFLVCPAGAFPRKTPLEQGGPRKFSPRWPLEAGAVPGGLFPREHGFSESQR